MGTKGGPISFTQLFKNKTTADDSIFFLQRVAYYTFAQIMCVRKVIPTSAYMKKVIEAQPTRLYVLKKEKDFVAQRAHSKLIGAFEGISKGYLKDLILVISNNQDDSDDALEVYEMRFVYGEQAHVEFLNSSGNRGAKITYRGSEHAEKDFFQFIDDVTTLCQVMEKLPKDSYCSFRSTFYDEVAPKDYIPTGWYNAQSLYAFNHPEALENLKIGQFQAADSGLFLSVKSVVIHDEVEMRELMKRARSDRSVRDDTLDKSILADESGFFEKNKDLGTSPIITGSINGAQMVAREEQLVVQLEHMVVEEHVTNKVAPIIVKSKGQTIQDAVDVENEDGSGVGPIKQVRRSQRKVIPQIVIKKGKTYRIDRSTPEGSLPTSPRR